MKLFAIFLLLGVLTTASALCQTFNEGNLLNIQNRERPQTMETVRYKGIPLVKIEPTIGAASKPEFKEWMDEERYRLFGSTHITDKSLNKENKSIPVRTNLQDIRSAVIPEYNITTPFGKKTTAAFIDHTTDFVSIIQLIDKNTILVEEQIQFITTKPLLWQRILPKNVLNIPQSKPLTIELISVEKNNKSISFNTEETEENLIINDTTQIEPGVYTFSLKYLVKNAILPYDGATRLAISLTGTQWPFPIDRFNLITLRPEKTTIFAKELLFGSNNMPILHSFDTQTDIDSNTFYTLTRPLPAFADVKVVEMFDGSNLLNPPFEEQLSTLLPFLTPVLSFLIAAFYLLISTFYLKKKKPDKDLLKTINNLPFFTLFFIQKRNLDIPFLKDIKSFQEYRKKRTILISLSIWLMHYKGTRFLLKQLLAVYSFLLLSFKYLITESLLIGLTFLLANTEKIEVNLEAWVILGMGIFILHILFFKFSLLPALQKETDLFKKRLLTPHAGFGLTEQGVLALYLRYYQTVISLDIHPKWASIIKESYPTLSLPFSKGV